MSRLSGSVWAPLCVMWNSPCLHAHLVVSAEERAAVVANRLDPVQRVKEVLVEVEGTGIQGSFFCRRESEAVEKERHE